jgi:hypothetical protein
MSKLRLTSIAAALFVIAALAQDLRAQQPVKNSSVDMGAFTKEIMALDFRDGQSHLAMWLPYEFFVAAALSEGTKTRSSVEKDLDFLTPYITVMVQNSIQQPNGSNTYEDEKTVRARAVLLSPDGKEISPLGEVPPMVTATISALKAILTAEGDAGSANMHLLVFPSLTPRGQKIVDTSRKDTLTLMLKANPRFRQTTFTWRTPFDSMVSVPDCLRCKSKVSAKWSYCPYCGQKLPHE